MTQLEKSTTQYNDYREDVKKILDGVEQVMYGMQSVTEMILISIICNDHILLEDVPGTGKTMLSNTISKILHLDFKRIQGTPDLLPSDLTGVTIFDQKNNKFKFIPGPIFTNILLFDEINRASPKTQSALLESMAEYQVSVDNQTYKLEKPFFVIATQNPVEHIGTYPLPQAQLDRFLFKTDIGYPTKELEKKIMMTQEDSVENVDLPSLKQDTIFVWQNEYQNVHVDENLLDKLAKIIRSTRNSGQFSLGISPRSGRKMLKALQACAYIRDKDYVGKDEVYDLFVPLMAHRVVSADSSNESEILEKILNESKI